MAGQGGKGGGVSQAPYLTNQPPNITNRGTFFNSEGVEMMPMNGPGGGSPIPLSDYNAQFGSPQPQQPFNVNNASAGALQNSMGVTTGLLGSPINQQLYSDAATGGFGQALGSTSNAMGSPINQQLYSDAATGGFGQAFGTASDLTSSLINQSGYSDAAGSGLGQSLDATSNIISDDLNIDAFNNPYQQEVVDNIQNDIERQRQIAINRLGADAEAAGAYGGSRQGVAEGTTNAEFGRMAANAIAPIRMQGYNTAVANAMSDRNARLGAANQLGGLANQTLGNAFSARNQQLGAANQLGGLSNTLLGNVLNTRGQQLGAANQMGGLANSLLGNVYTSQGNQLGAANQLGGLANQAFQTGRTINNDLMSQGLLQQALQQQLIDSARTDFGNYAASPADSLTMPLTALGVVPKPQSTMTRDNYGILGTLGALKYVAPGMGIFGP